MSSSQPSISIATRTRSELARPTTPDHGGAWVWAAAAVALALRLAHLVSLNDADPLLLAPMLDAKGYHEWALAILRGQSDQVFFQDPAYPYFIALVYWLSARDPLAVALAQSLLGALTVLLVARAARRLSPRPARSGEIAAAWIAALYQPLFFYGVLLLKVQLANLLVVVALLLYLRALNVAPGELRRATAAFVGTGFVFGILCLLRGNFYLALPPLVLWASWSQLRATPRLDLPRGSPRLRRVFLPAVALCAGFLLVPAGIGLRNRLVSGEWAFVSAHAGSVLYYGNNPYSPLGEFKRLPFVRADPRFEEADFRAEARRRTGKQLNSLEASKFWRGEALRYISSDPVLALRRTAHKLRLLVESYEHPDNYSLKFHGLFSYLVRPVIPWWSVVLALSAAFLVAIRSHGPSFVPALLLGGSYALSLLLFWVNSRYRMPLVPLLSLLAGAELSTWISQLRARRFRALLGRGAVALSVLALSLFWGVPRARLENLGSWWAALGSQHAQVGELGEAERLMTRGLELDPQNGIILANLGRLSLRRGQLARAGELCARATRVPGDQIGARECLALARLAAGDPKAAIAALRPAIDRAMPLTRHLLLTQIYERAGLIDRAVRQLRAALAEHGDHPAIHVHLARLLEPSDPAQARRHRRTVQALEHGRGSGAAWNSDP